MLIVTPGVATASHGAECNCPEDEAGWIVYPDSSRGAPDFFAKSSVSVNEIVFCERGVHFLFHAKQSGQRRKVCLIVAEPQYSRHFAVDSLMDHEHLAVLQDDVEWRRRLFTGRVQDLRNMVGAPAGESGRVTFETGWFKRPPRIYPGKPLAVRWKGREVELVGNLDVYFRP